MGAKDFLRKAFPFLTVAATAFGGPVGAAGANILGAALGEKIKPEELEAKLTTLTMTEEGRLKAQDAEASFKLAMEKMGFDHIEELEKVAAGDRDSARKREMAIKDKMPMILGVGVNAVFFAVIGFLIFKPVPDASKDVLLILLGALTVQSKEVYGYYFGSSAGSAKKDDILATTTK